MRIDYKGCRGGGQGHRDKVEKGETVKHLQLNVSSSPSMMSRSA